MSGQAGAGNKRGASTASAFSFLNRQAVGMAVSEFIAADRRERRVLVRVSRAAWRLGSAEPERDWALGSARSEGVSIRKLSPPGCRRLG